MNACMGAWAFSIGIAAGLADAAGAARFRFADAKGNLDLLYGETPVYRLMAAYDGKDSTKKVFHHVYGFHGEGFITKGAGRLWGHHRGIWLGWSDVLAQGKDENFWECPDGNSQRHSKYLPEREAANEVFARRASQTEWVSAAGDTLGRDIREVTAWFPADGILAMDYAVQVISPKGDMTVKATPAHGGLQFRSDSQDDTATLIMPKDAVLQPADVIGVKDSNSWVYSHFNIKGTRYGVLAMDHPASPRPSKQNFRGYGRIGAYYGNDKLPPITPAAPMKIWARFLVFDVAKFAKLDQAALQGYYDAYRKVGPAETLPKSTVGARAIRLGRAVKAKAGISLGAHGHADVIVPDGRGGWVGPDGKRTPAPRDFLLP